MAALPSVGRAANVEPRVATPEADAARVLYERHSQRVVSYCAHRLGSRDEAEDAAQTTFLQAFRGLQRGVVPQSEIAWLLKIAENVCLSRHRASARRGKLEVTRDPHALADVVAAPATSAEELDGVAEVLAGLPENQRRAILLREWQGLSYREIAAELGLSQAATETLIFRARRSLVRGLERRDAAPRRLHGLNVGSLFTAVKSSLTAAPALKVAALAVAVSTAAIAAGKPLLTPSQDSRPPAPVERVQAPVADPSAASSAIASSHDDLMRLKAARTREERKEAQRVGKKAPRAAAPAIGADPAPATPGATDSADDAAPGTTDAVDGAVAELAPVTDAVEDAVDLAKPALSDVEETASDVTETVETTLPPVEAPALPAAPSVTLP